MCFTLLTSWEFVDFWVISRVCVCVCIGERGKEGEFVSVYVCPYYREPPTAACLSWCLTHGEIYTSTLHPRLCHSVRSHVLRLYTLDHFLFLHLVPSLLSVLCEDSWELTEHLPAVVVVSSFLYYIFLCASFSLLLTWMRHG